MRENETFKKTRRTTQIEKTNQDFVTALIINMKQKDINKIKINELVETAGYSRRTFYRHFESVDDILIYFIDSLIESLFKQIYQPNLKINHFDELLELFLDFWKPKKPILRLLHEQNRFYLLTTLAMKNINNSKLDSMIKDDDNKKYVEQYAVSSIFAILEVWIFDDQNPDSKSIAQSIINHDKKVF